MSEDFVNKLQSSKQLILLFNIFDDSNSNIYLTSSSEEINFNNKLYLPYSGLSIKDASFSDNILTNYVELSGVFEEKGIKNVEFIMQKNVEISILVENQIQQFISYFCYKVVNDESRFTLILKSPLTKLANNNIIEFYSPTCRANFADNRCKCDKYEYTDEVKIIYAKLNTIKFQTNRARADGYYNFGYITIEDINFKAKIMKHQLNVITLDDRISYNESLVNLKAELTAGCDKAVGTCIKKFNNIVNFRGEPFVDN